MTLIPLNNLRKTIGFIAVFCSINLFCALCAAAQDIEAKIKLISVSPDKSLVRVEGKLLNLRNIPASSQISFLQNYADVFNLDARIGNLNLFDENGAKIQLKKIAAGEFQSDTPFASFAYDVVTNVPESLTSAAHVSWLNENRGLLMLSDLLPQLRIAKSVSARITLEIPNNWTVSSSETQNGKNVFDVKDIEKSVFFIGENRRERQIQIDKTNLNLAIAGEWQFSDDEAVQMADSIFEEYQKIFGTIPVQKAQIILLPFPKKTSRTDRWRAETRGSTVTLISGAVPLKSQALQRLHEQLRHEIFHLWIPNALKLSGNYDWFFEGFTVYQALRAGVEVNQIRFDDYLNTLANAFDLAQNQNASLIEISRNRWTGSNSSVYPKGMVAAFLCDAALLRESKGNRSLKDVFRQIFQKYSAFNSEPDATAAILNALKSYPELRPIVQSYIEGNEKIDWQDDLKAFGIEIHKSETGTKLKVAVNVNKRQKDLLDKLGYNQWRKLVERMK